LRIGTTLLSTGALLVAFVAYQLWGTALYEHGAQQNLRHELSRTIGRERLIPPTSTTTEAGSRGPKATSTIAARPTTTTTSPPATRHRVTTTTTTTTTTSTTTTVVTPFGSAAAPPASPSPPVVSHGPAAYGGYLAPTTGDPAVNSPVGYLSIPKIGLDEAIVEGVGEPQLQQGPGHYPGTPLPGEAGNVGIAGHRTTYAAPFYNLNELQPGDPIYVQTVQGTFTYQVTQSLVVLPTDVSVLDPTPQPTLTLTTCNPRYSASQRLVVKANLVASQPPAGGTPTTTAPSSEGHLPTTLAGEAPANGSALAGSSQGITLVVVWGVAAAALAIAVLLVRRRRSLPRLLRLGSVALGTPLFLGALFLFFAHVSTALPGSF
jgi:sortase A